MRSILFCLVAICAFSLAVQAEAQVYYQAPSGTIYSAPVYSAPVYSGSTYYVAPRQSTRTYYYTAPRTRYYAPRRRVFRQPRYYWGRSMYGSVCGPGGCY